MGGGGWRSANKYVEKNSLFSFQVLCCHFSSQKTSGNKKELFIVYKVCLSSGAREKIFKTA